MFFRKKNDAKGWSFKNKVLYLRNLIVKDYLT